MRSAFEVRGKPDADLWILGAIAAVISLAAFFYYFHNGSLLLYGDAVAHMNIARRTIDSRTPGLLQLGTVWLPLAHILMLPLVAFTWMWRTGVGGAIPSMIAYVASVLAVFRLVRGGLQRGFGLERESRMAAWFAALTLAANPNLIYLQTTAMTESLYLAFFIWATVYFSDFVFGLRDGKDEAAQRALVRSGFFLFLGMLTRYDGWFAGATYGLSATLVIAFAMHHRGERWMNLLRDPKWRHAFAGFALWLIITPAIWFPWNWLGFEDPMAFATGPYSARGIEQRTRKPDQPHHPGWNNPRVATLYFVKSAKLNMAAGNGEQRAWIWFAVLGSMLCLLWARRLWMWLLLWVPVPFYALSIAHGGVPIFLPEWYPFSYYNTRYGTQLFLAIIVFSALLLFFLMVKVEEPRWQVRLMILAFAFVASSYIFVWRQTPVVLREAIVNARTRVAFETKLAAELAKIPPDASILMYSGEHGGALQRLGMPLKRTLNEGNRKAWKKALPDPAAAADYVVATQGDDVAAAVANHPEGLEKIAEVQSEGQNPATIYRSLAHHASGE